MPSKLNPYISFNGNAKNAMEFYKTVFGGSLTMNTFKEGGMPCELADENKIMHATLIADNGMTLMASDTPPRMPFSPGTNIAVAVGGSNEKEIRGYWDKLYTGATITIPINKASWGDIFGMLTDKFGIGWMVNISVKNNFN